MRIDHDSSELEIMDGVNKSLEAYGLQFVDDGKEHDGFIIYNLIDYRVNDEPMGYVDGEGGP
jgi:predicted choloylglycine hydrolase